MSFAPASAPLHYGATPRALGLHAPMVYASLPAYSIGVTCPSCSDVVTSRVEHVATARTHLHAVIATLVLCCWLPYVTNFSKTTNHYCPRCGTFMGSNP